MILSVQSTRMLEKRSLKMLSAASVLEAKQYSWSRMLCISYRRSIISSQCSGLRWDVAEHGSALQNGRVVEEGTYLSLMASQGPFSRMIADFGGSAEEKHEVQDAKEEEVIEQIPKTGVEDLKVLLTRKRMGKAAGTGKLEGRLMQAETRKTGSIGRRGQPRVELQNLWR